MKDVKQYTPTQLEDHFNFHFKKVLRNGELLLGEGVH